MAKKKKARKAKRTKTSRGKLTRKTRKAGARKVARKKAARKAPRRKVAKPVKQAGKRAAPQKAVRKAAARPKLPRRVPQAAPPPRPPPPPIAPPPVVDVEPVARVTPPPPAPSPGASGTSWGTSQEEEAGPPTAGVGGRGPGVGDMAPAFELPDQTGKTHALAQYRGRKVVLYFYPKDDTPGCTVEACGFRDALGVFDARGATVLGISPDPVASHERFGQKYSLTFPLLADEGHVVAQRYGVWVKKIAAGQTRMGIARTTFVIDPSGRIAQVFKSVRPQGHPDEVLRSL
jgi:peroxiredoxin Q/BCP